MNRVLMTSLKLFFLMSVSMPFVPIFAGHVTSNGGNAVVCKDDHFNIASVELFDYYEARQQYQIKIDMDPMIQDPVLLAETTMRRLERLDPQRVNRYIDQIRKFSENTNLVPGVTLEYVADSHRIITPARCEIRQLAIQRQPQFPHDRYFTVSKDLWDYLSVKDRAGLILHEVIYREAITYGHKSSVQSRYFTSIISSHELDHLTPDTYTDLLYRIGFIASLNFKQIEPRYSGIFSDLEDYAADNIKKICATQPAGSLIVAKDRRGSESAVCLGAFGPGDKPFFKDYLLDNLTFTSVYLAVFTDEVDGIMDTSVIGLFETETGIIPFCKATSFSDETMRASYVSPAVNKANAAQVQSLQSGKGVCQNFFLDDYRDFTRGTLFGNERIQKVTLKRVL